MYIFMAGVSISEQNKIKRISQTHVNNNNNADDDDEKNETH